VVIELIHSKPHLVFGCGNPLFGDDGFGPEVIEHLEKHHDIPDHVACVDAGTSIREILFDLLLSPEKPRQILIVDASEQKNRTPGEIYEIDVDHISPKKISDFSLHQFPTANMLKEIAEQTDIEVRVLVVQVAHIPSEINPGMSTPVRSAVPEMCSRIIEIVKEGLHD
jgi:coenzyme F420 hydrogenase subunit delta